MSTASHKLKSDLWWRRDRACTLVIDESLGRVYRLSGIPELVWHCLVLSYEENRIVNFIALAQAKMPEEAQLELEAVLEEWLESGILQVREAGYGEPGHLKHL
jgi:hypothetical protein